ncbi:IclR family transcriptional regulator [Trichlorobacter ammonificans]|uniref:IclR family transcriptional regulator n=1 Tax=Trichlorobacter ammonificans TaxID=2916410 RepID=A0ABN8HH20_9BACT|nr:IclR family transcriptional regulator [Trichlorobacter ammonificans]CAH2030890.1 IclR family transcriptional regulator [Trichlorobacter ammonificans]
MREKGHYSVQAVVKALELLEALAGDVESPTIPLLASKLSLSRNKTFRLLATLEEKGLVERNGDSGTFQLGVQAFEMAQHILKSASLLKMAQPVMEELARKLDEAVYITVMSNDEVLFLDMVDCLQQVKAVDMVGKRFPFFTNAAGKVIKSLSSPDLLTRGRRRRDIPDPEALERELQEIRKRGVAVDFNGLGDGLCAVAVAIRDYAGKVVCSLTVLAPAFRMIQDRLEREVIPCMLEGAETLSSKFGYSRAYA